MSGRLERFRVGGAGFGMLLDVEQDFVAPLLPLCAVQTEQLVGADFKKTGDGGQQLDVRIAVPRLPARDRLRRHAEEGGKLLLRVFML